jgi:serine/threonine protein kinase
MERDDAIVSALLLGRYRVEGILGEGGLGSVVRAFDQRLKRTVAIKSLKRSLATIEPAQLRAIEDRFSREAIAGSRMGSHPNLVAVYDLVTGPDETLYLILEYVSGGTLAERIRADGALPLADTLRLTADIARGLQAAHDVGLVHRDIKPANIFIAADGRAQVGDFGIAQIDDLSGRTQATVGHPGTPLYMSPEQASTTGYLQPVSDQYSLGLVLFEMLTGKAYKRLRASDAVALLAAHPRPIGAMIERLIAENPADRYPEMTNVLQATQAIANVMAFESDERPPSFASETPHQTPRPTPPVNLQPMPPVEAPPPTVHTPPPPAPAPQYYLPQPQSPRAIGRRAVLVGIGGLAVAGAASGAYLLTGRETGSSASVTATPLQSAVAAQPTLGQPTSGPLATATATIALPTATATPRPTVTPGPTSTPVVAAFSSRVITDSMSHPEQWQQANLPGQSSRALDKNIYTVRVTKKPDGTGLFSWGDWVPAAEARGPEFIAEVEMRVQGDPEGAAGGLIFLYNYVSQGDQQQYLDFIIRADGRFMVAQQLTGGEGHKMLFNDWTQHAAIKPGRDIMNLLRVEVRSGAFSCYVNNQPVMLAQTIPAEVAPFSALSLAADVLTASTEPEAAALFSAFRYEKLTR